MKNLSQELIAQLPKISVFFAKPVRLSAGQSSVVGIHETRLVRSNGINMLCCNEEGQLYLVALQDTVKVSPQNTDKFICRYDSTTGCILAKDTETNKVHSMGPVRGQPDANINLGAIAKELGVDLAELSVGSKLSKPNVEHQHTLTTDEIKQGPTEKTYEELIASGNDGVGELESLDDFEPPDLSDFEVDESEID
jgi:hypothetical protein